MRRAGNAEVPSFGRFCRSPFRLLPRTFFICPVPSSCLTVETNTFRAREKKTEPLSYSETNTAPTRGDLTHPLGSILETAYGKV